MSASTRESAAMRAPFWAMAIGTFFGIGRLRPAPGTWASAATVLVWSAIAHFTPSVLQTPLAISLAGFVTLIGIPAATGISRAMGNKDPQVVVIDEVAGQLIALIAAPLGWKTFLTAFILFRGFDIVKPPPVRQLESLPEGAGIVLDDVAAGIYALVVMQILLRIFHLLT